MGFQATEVNRATTTSRQHNLSNPNTLVPQQHIPSHHLSFQARHLATLNNHPHNSNIHLTLSSSNSK